MSEQINAIEKIYFNVNFFYTLLYLTTLDVAEVKVDDDAVEGDGEVVAGGAESGPGLFFLSQSANLTKNLILETLELIECDIV